MSADLCSLKAFCGIDPELAQRIADLEHELRVSRFNEETQRQRADGLAANFQRYHDEDELALKRVRGLVNVQRRTVSMDDLRRALGQLDT